MEIKVSDNPAAECAGILREAAEAGAHIALTGGSTPGKAYELARRNALPVPVLRFGRKMAIPSRALDRLLLVDESTSSASVQSAS